MNPVMFFAQFSWCVCLRMAVLKLLVQPYLNGHNIIIRRHLLTSFAVCVETSVDTEYSLSPSVDITSQYSETNAAEEQIVGSFLGSCFHMTNMVVCVVKLKGLLPLFWFYISWWSAVTNCGIFMSKCIFCDISGLEKIQKVNYKKMREGQTHGKILRIWGLHMLFYTSCSLNMYILFNKH